MGGDEATVDIDREVSVSDVLEEVRVCQWYFRTPPPSTTRCRSEALLPHFLDCTCRCLIPVVPVGSWRGG